MKEMLLFSIIALVLSPNVFACPDFSGTYSDYNEFENSFTIQQIGCEKMIITNRLLENGKVVTFPPETVMLDGSQNTSSNSMVTMIETAHFVGDVLEIDGLVDFGQKIKTHGKMTLNLARDLVYETINCRNPGESNEVCENKNFVSKRINP